MSRAGAAGRSLIVEADDLGLSHSFNAGIREAATRGVLTSTNVRVNGPAFEAALAEVVPECPGLGLGVHLNIVEGRTTRRRMMRASRICDADGRYRASFPRLLASQRDRRLLAEIEADYRDQIEAGLSRLPRVDHLNSHQHSHAVPALFDLACRLAVEYAIPYVRLPRERPYLTRPLERHAHPWYAVNLVKLGLLDGLAGYNIRAAARHGVRTNAALVGIAYTGHMDATAIVRGLDATRPGDDPVEVLLHPSWPVQGATESYLRDESRRYDLDPWRERELATLVDPDLRDQVTRRRWRLTHYGQLADGASRGASPRTVDLGAPVPGAEGSVPGAPAPGCVGAPCSDPAFG